MAPAASRIQGAKKAINQRLTDQSSYKLFPGRRYDVDGKLVTLEDMYLVDSHPQRRNVSGGKTYIYYQDTSIEGCASTWEQEKGLKVPLGSYETILELGTHASGSVNCQ